MRISLSECKHGYLYRVSAYNFFLGVFNSTDDGFIGIREKFGRQYLDTEYHREYNGPFPTVSPFEELEKIPEHLVVEENNSELLEYLKQAEIKYYVRTDHE